MSRQSFKNVSWPMDMSNRKRLFALLLIMGGVAVAASTFVIWVLSQAVFEQERGRLGELAGSQARMINSMAELIVSLGISPDEVNDAIVSQFRRSHETLPGFGATGEFVLGRLEGENIVFLLPPRFPDRGPRDPVSFQSGWAKPMRRALMGRSGTLIGPDYGGVEVLAAYESLAVVNLGVVAKIDIEELHAPFIRAGIISGVGAIFIIVLGGGLFHRISTPIAEDLEATVTSLSDAQRIAHLGNWKRDFKSGIISWSDETYRIFGLDPNDIEPNFETYLEKVHPDDRQNLRNAQRPSFYDGKHHTMDFRIIRADKAVRILHRRSELILDDAGIPTQIHGTVQDITEFKKMEEKIKASLREKEVLIEEIHHRVKNNLQVISSMLWLQANAEENARTVAVLRDSHRRIMLMAKIHESLHHHNDLSVINAREFLSTLVTDTKKSNGASSDQISFHIDVDDIPLDIGHASAYGQIISELISNSFKHAFKNGQAGNIDISLRQVDGGATELSVADDGQGLPGDFDVQRANTLGLQLVGALAARHGGTVDIDRSAGTRIQINFPRE